MALVALDGNPLVLVGAPTRGGSILVANPTSVTMDAAEEATIMVAQIRNPDGGSHTIDTTGSSSLGWRTGAVTNNNGGTTVKVGLAEVDAANGPPARAVNVANVITFDVSKSMTGGGGGVTANAWQEHVPDAGTKTIANGDLVAFCVQMTARGGADSVLASVVGDPIAGTTRLPCLTSYTGGVYANAGMNSNFVITYSDGTRGYPVGGIITNGNAGATTWNNTSGTKEYGNYYKLPVPVKIYGINAQLTPTSNFDIVLYSDPLGTPVAEKTYSIDSNQVGAATVGGFYIIFSSPYSLAANTPIAGIIKPTSASNVSAWFKSSVNIAEHQESEQLGQDCYAISRNTGAFAAVNSNKDRYAQGLLIGAFEHPARSSYVMGM
jgi:hypothetical protein